MGVPVQAGGVLCHAVTLLDLQGATMQTGTVGAGGYCPNAKPALTFDH